MAETTEAGNRPPEPRLINLTVNGESLRVSAEPRRVLLDVLRHDLGLTGARKVCSMGDCGACTVHLDGEAVYSCLVLGVECEDHQIDTIEGQADANRLTALQQAFIDADAFQCGYCTPGQIMSLQALFNTDSEPDDTRVLRAISGNLCRCGAYPNIMEAARQYRAHLSAGGARNE